MTKGNKKALTRPIFGEKPTLTKCESGRCILTVYHNGQRFCVYTPAVGLLLPNEIDDCRKHLIETILDRFYKEEARNAGHEHWPFEVFVKELDWDTWQTGWDDCYKTHVDTPKARLTDYINTFLVLVGGCTLGLLGAYLCIFA